ncbi:unnamed protein product [Linum tenue]|uniref:Uncharacterized protein n=1 Tax=Linum tenue TaxID=586396 RepID=A0AAV0RP46_9ROSI|nr:unnamed protein product [Linum tenue]
MPPMKIQPIDVDSQTQPLALAIAEPAKPVLKSRLKRLFDRQLPSVLRISSADKPNLGDAQYVIKDAGVGGGGVEFEPSSVCLAKMVQSYMEETSEKTLRGRTRCNCFNGNTNDSSDDEFEAFDGGFGESNINSGPNWDASDVLKSLIPSASKAERNLLADTAAIVKKKSSSYKLKGDLRKIVADELSALGYDCSICKSKWEKASSYPAGEYEYLDVIADGERLLIDVDFRSEFEIARSTSAYKAFLQSLPHIFVGKADRLGQIVSIVAEAARQSLKKKGMHFPPWRRAEYLRAKWLSPFTRAPNDSEGGVELLSGGEGSEEEGTECCGELELIFGEKATALSETSSGEEGMRKVEAAVTWQPPAVKPKSAKRKTKMVTGLASLLKEKP